MQIFMLGTFRIGFTEKSTFSPAPPKERTVLALLANYANRIASLDTIIDELWGNDPPKTAAATARTYIYHLRKTLDGFSDDPGSDMLVGRAPGYVLQLPAEMIDANVFCNLVTKGRMLLSEDRPEDAGIIVREALRMWQGPALGNVPLGRTLSTYATFLDEERRRANEIRIMADMRLGRHRELISEIRTLVTEDPLNEWMSAQLMISLSQCGRRGEALGVFAKLRKELKTQLGLEPSRDLQRLQKQLLVPEY